jgi:hypothetical protein
VVNRQGQSGRVNNLVFAVIAVNQGSTPATPRVDTNFKKLSVCTFCAAHCDTLVCWFEENVLGELSGSSISRVKGFERLRKHFYKLRQC